MPSGHRPGRPLHGSLPSHGTRLLTSLQRGSVAAAARRRLGFQTPLVMNDDALERVEALASTDPVLVAGIAGLSPEQTAALWARVVDEEEYGAIAARLDCSELVVRQRVSRALRTLRHVVAATHREQTS